MGKAEIIDALSQLSLAERSEVLARLVQLEAAVDQYPFRRPRHSRSGGRRLAPGDVEKTQAGTVPLPR
jgi:hypothetical protein